MVQLCRYDYTYNESILCSNARVPEAQLVRAFNWTVFRRPTFKYLVNLKVITFLHQVLCKKTPPSEAHFYHLFPSVPTEPRSIRVLSLAGSPTELLVTWDPPAEPNGIILLYTVYCYVLSNDSFTNQPFLAPLDALVTAMPLYIEVPGNQTEAVMEDLVPYTSYLCLVTANTSIGESNSSSIQLNQTDESGKLTF